MAWLGYTVNCTGILARDFFLTERDTARHAVDLAACGWLIGRFIDPDAGFSFVDAPTRVPPNATYGVPPAADAGWPCSAASNLAAQCGEQK
jgi:hypothetical protein